MLCYKIYKGILYIYQSIREKPEIMEGYGNNGIFGVDRKQTHAGGGWETGNLFGVALVLA